MRYTTRYIAPLAALLLAGCTQAPKTNESPAKPVDMEALAIEGVTKAKESRREALSSGNIENYLSVYADDAVIVPPHSGEIVGKELARVRLKQVMDQVTVETTTLSDEIDLLADGIAMDRGRYASSSTLKSGGVARADGGNYMIVWKRNPAGEWKIAYEMWTSKEPLTGGVK